MDDSGPPAALDSSRPFMPEHLTPLFHTSAYAALTRAQQLRYNQLQSCCHNELTTFFEVSLAHTFVPALIATGELAAMEPELRRFAAEEDRHIEMFRRLNRRSAPALYAGQDFHFVRLPRFAQWLIRRATASPRLFPLFAWMMLIQEERSAYYSEEVLRHAGTLEPHYVRTHRAHLADETGHIGWDERIIAATWQQRPRALRVLNAWLLGWLLATFFSAPRRAAVRVIGQLVADFPELEPRAAALRQALLELSRREDYRRTLYARAMVPRSFAGFDRWPEFARLQRWLPGYLAAAGL